MTIKGHSAGEDADNRDYSSNLNYPKQSKAPRQSKLSKLPTKSTKRRIFLLQWTPKTGVLEAPPRPELWLPALHKGADARKKHDAQTAHRCNPHHNATYIALTQLPEAPGAYVAGTHYVPQTK